MNFDPEDDDFVSRWKSLQAEIDKLPVPTRAASDVTRHVLAAGRRRAAVRRRWYRGAFATTLAVAAAGVWLATRPAADRGAPRPDPPPVDGAGTRPPQVYDSIGCDPAGVRRLVEPGDPGHAANAGTRPYTLRGPKFTVRLYPGKIEAESDEPELADGMLMIAFPTPTGDARPPLFLLLGRDHPTERWSGRRILRDPDLAPLRPAGAEGPPGSRVGFVRAADLTPAALPELVAAVAADPDGTKWPAWFAANESSLAPPVRDGLGHAIRVRASTRP